MVNILFLHPQASACIELDGAAIGCLGMLHPRYEAMFELTMPAWLFEITLPMSKHQCAVVPQYQAISSYPLLRRDISLIIDKAIPVADLLHSLEQLKISSCQAISVLDIYTASGVDEANKSVLLELVFQDQQRTLDNDEVAGYVEQMIDTLQKQYNAHIKRA